jgi:hypothetical protein
MITGILFSTCVKEAVPASKQYPFVITLAPENNDSTGITLSGNITDMGRDEILEFGFVYNTEQDPTIENFLIKMEGAAKAGEYNYRITSGLEKGQTYWVRTYVKTTDYLVYGNSNSFTSLGSFRPLIAGFSPVQGHAGTRVVITGSNFSLAPERNLVKFGDISAVVDSASVDRLIVEVPALKENTKVDISLNVAGMDCKAPGSFTVHYSWIKMNNITAGEIQMEAAFTLGDKGYLLGGILYEPGLDYGQWTSRLWEYDMSGDTWTEKKEAPYDPWQGIPLAAFSYGSKGYSIIQNETMNMYEYDPATDQWTLISHYPGQSENLVYFVIGDELYIGLGTDYYMYYNEFYRYSFASNNWTRLNDFPGKPRDGAVAFTLNGKGYMGTGRNYREGAYLTDLWEYDPALDQWTARTGFPGTGRYMGVAFTLGGKGFVGLGTREENYEGYADFWCYDPGKDSWERKDDYPGGGKWLNTAFSNESRVFIAPGSKTDLYSSWSIWRGFNDLWEFVDN